MKTYIALLRGIGGQYTLPMKDLVTLLEKMGLANVRTYIQSGNAIFQSGATGTSKLPEKIQSAINSRYGFAPHVIMLTLDELHAAVEANPFPEAATEPTTLHLSFLASTPEHPDFATLDRIKTDSERFILKGKVFYCHTPDGAGRSKLFSRIEKSLGVTATARNWRSVCRIKAMAEQMAQ
jgi:uncharacterized protein (DUF1697 family)